MEKYPNRYELSLKFKTKGKIYWDIIPIDFERKNEGIWSRAVKYSLKKDFYSLAEAQKYASIAIPCLIDNVKGDLQSTVEIKEHLKKLQVSILEDKSYRDFFYDDDNDNSFEFINKGNNIPVEVNIPPEIYERIRTGLTQKDIVDALQKFADEKEKHING